MLVRTTSGGLINSERRKHPEKPEGPPRQRAHSQCRQQHADRGERADGPLVLEQALEIDVQRTGEKQEAQHAVHERLVEVDLAEKAGEHFPQAPTWHDGISGHHDNRTHQRDGQRAGGGGEL